MSDIVCQYKINNGTATTEGYFLVEPQIRLSPLRQILSREYLQGETNFHILSHGQVIRSDNQLHKVLSQEPVVFTLMLHAQLPVCRADAVEEEEKEKAAPADEPQEDEEEEEKKAVAAPESDSFTLGPNLQQILRTYGVTVQEGQDPKEIVESLPAPLPRLIINKGQKALKNPKFTKCIAKRLAKRFNLPKKELKHELREALEHADFLREMSPNRAEKPSMEAEMGVRVPRCARLGGHKKAIHHATCDECQQRICGIRYKCLVCPDFDLCEKCEENNSHPHVFAKLYTNRDYQTVQSLMNPVDNFRGPCPPLFAARMQRGKARIDSLEASVQTLQEQVAGLMANRAGDMSEEQQ